MTANESTVKTIEETINNALDGDVASAVANNGWSGMEIVMAIIASAGVLIAGLHYFFPRSPKPSKSINPVVVTEKQREEQQVIYEATRLFLRGIGRDGGVEYEEIHTFTRQVQDAGFLFGDEIRNYLDELRSKAIDMKLKRTLGQHREHSALLVELVEEDTSGRLYERFKPFLQLNGTN